MAKKQRTYDMEYKIQAVKLAKELGGAKAVAEFGIPENTIYNMDKGCQRGKTGYRFRPTHPGNLQESCSGAGNVAQAG